MLDTGCQTKAMLNRLIVSSFAGIDPIAGLERADQIKRSLRRNRLDNGRNAFIRLQRIEFAETD